MSVEALTVYGYWRSSAAYRVRIGLNLKGLPYAQRYVHLLREGGEQHGAAYRARNPQGLIPLLMHGDVAVRQSLAILEYLDQVFAQRPLLPKQAAGRAHVRALAQMVACDIHPLNNMRVLKALENEFDANQAARIAWIHHWMREGFAAIETILRDDPRTAGFVLGDAPGLAECFLVPQLYNARRFEMDLSAYPTLVGIEQACMALPAFEAARPENQPDAPRAESMPLG